MVILALDRSFFKNTQNDDLRQFTLEFSQKSNSKLFIKIVVMKILSTPNTLKVSKRNNKIYI